MRARTRVAGQIVVEVHDSLCYAAIGKAAQHKMCASAFKHKPRFFLYFVFEICALRNRFTFIRSYYIIIVYILSVFVSFDIEKREAHCKSYINCK